MKKNIESRQVEMIQDGLSKLEVKFDKTFQEFNNFISENREFCIK